MARASVKRKARKPRRSRLDGVGFAVPEVVRRAEHKASEIAHRVGAKISPYTGRVERKYSSLGSGGKALVGAGIFAGSLFVFAKLSNRIDVSAVEDYAQAAEDTVVDTAKEAAKAVETGAIKVGNLIFGAAERAALSAIAPAGAQQYIADLLQVASANDISPFVLLGLVNQESGWGKYLSPKNSPSGTGDFGARDFSPSKHQALVDQGLLKIVPDVDSLPAGWKLAATAVTDGPYIIPADGGGFGRGFVQFDYVTGPVAVRQANFLGNVQVQLQAAADLLKQKQTTLLSLLRTYNSKNPNSAVALPDGAGLLAATIASYNHGEGTVAKNIEQGNPLDYYGNGKNNNYSNLVLGMAANYGTAFNNQLAA